MPDPHDQLPAGATGRCVRGRDCIDTVRGTDPDDPGRMTSLGAPSAAPLCPTCVRYLRYTLGALPYDMAELGQLLIPSMAVKYRAPDMPPSPRFKKHSPMPLNGNALALQELIDHEITSWAESVADACSMPWDAQVEARMRPTRRVRNGAQLLAYRTSWLLGLPPQRHRVRSAGERPTDGWPEHLVDRMEVDPHGQWWIERDGTEAALTIFGLHTQVEGFVGRTPADRCPLPCPKCGRRALVREHRSERLVCRYCWEPLSDDAYDQMIDQLAGGLGVLR